MLSMVWRDVSNWDECILESIATAIITTDLNATIRSVNRAAEIMYEIPRQKAIGSSFFDGLAPNERTRLVKTFQYVIRTGKTFSGKEIPVITRGGKTIIIKPIISQLKDHEGNVIGMVMLTEDITEKHYLEKNIQRSDKLAALGSLAAGVAHEIRNPLGTVKGFATLIKRGLPEGDQKQQYADVIIKETDRLARVTQELLDFARQGERRFTLIQINEVIDKALFLLEMNSSITKIEVTRQFKDDLPDILGNEEQLIQALLNLFQNSVEAVSENGQIVIATSYARSGHWVEVCISDNGSGISSEDIQHIFDPFFTTRERGTGLGLSLVHQVVSNHGGHIRVDSKPGKCTRFFLRFPCKEGMKIIV